MHYLEFNGTVPDNEIAVNYLNRTIAQFSGVRNRLETSGLAELDEENKTQLAEEFEVDRFLVEDVFRVVKGLVRSPINTTQEGVFWTLGRQASRWGMPWANVSLEDNRAFIHIRWGGSFDDIEDPPRTIRCPVTFAASDLEIEKTLLASHRLDLWMRSDGRNVSGIVSTD